jgi:hypothetical protein
VIVQSFLVVGGALLALGGLSFAPRWVQVGVVAVLAGLGGHLACWAAVMLDGSGLLAGLVLGALAWGLNAILTDIRRAHAAALPPSGQAPGGASAPGAAGERDGERNAPILPDGVSTPTAGCAGRPRSFSVPPQ